MSVTAGIWATLFVGLTLMSLKRPVYAVALYLLTFFAAPQLWWWGDDLPELRYALIAGFILLAAVIFDSSRSEASGSQRWSIVHYAAIGMAFNATFVHFALASNPSVSLDNYVEMLKLILVTFLFWQAIQTKQDLHIVLITVALGAAYIGYEVTFNERGYFDGGRLEGVGVPGAFASNSLADLMLTSIPLIGALVIQGWVTIRALGSLAAALALNVLLLCNSRGAFLGLLGAALTFLWVAKGPTRKQAIKALAVGGLALFLLLGDPDIAGRFATTFAGSEERDSSATSRIEFWQAGLLMLSDYPLGDGGNSFKDIHGAYYISQVTGQDAEDRSLHNGYLTEATEWGLQGLLLRLVFLGGAILAARRAERQCRRDLRMKDALVGISLVVALAGYMIHCMFGSFIANEWGYWTIPLLLRYSDTYATYSDTDSAA